MLWKPAGSANKKTLDVDITRRRDPDFERHMDAGITSIPPERKRVRLAVHGAVQGVGFRPFVHRLATGLGLAGWVNNSPQGVFIEVEGSAAALDEFLARIGPERPPHSFIQSLEATWLETAGYDRFEIRASDTGGVRSTLVLPDLATCPDCLADIRDPANRRFRYPFTNCTHCGPRFSIIEALPYDRASTSMRRFVMCPACQAEYEDPGNRRFHAQPNACPACGPHLELWDWRGMILAREHGALLAAAAAVRRGQIVAVKGLGGFHLMTAAGDAGAVRRLRERKHREEKPFAVMFPTLEQARECCRVSPQEERLLLSPASPIVLLRRTQVDDSLIAPPVVPGNPRLGILLPYTPLHHLLMAELGFPVVATSGNLSDEPICIDEREALDRLGGIADVFLVHNRPIVRHVDDSLARIMLGREQVLRRARGYAPLPVLVRETEPAEDKAILAVGAHLKNAVALADGPRVFISQHVGDLETGQADTAFRDVIADLQSLLDLRPSVVVADTHPDYRSTQWAEEHAGKPGAGCRLVRVQHHVAHACSCMAENELEPPVLGVSWDGTGHGLDSTIWGGEFFHITAQGWRRVAHLRTFRLPGGDQAIKEPRRAALGLLHEMLGPAAFDRPGTPVADAFAPEELRTIRTMLERDVHSPRTSSAGRLFDAVASLVGLRHRARHEGQAAMELEFAAEQAMADCALRIADFQIRGSDSPSKDAPMVLDWEPMIASLLDAVREGKPVSWISTAFHAAMAGAIALVAGKAGVKRVVLSGGCFQNQRLMELTVALLRKDGFEPFWHQRVPPNDGGIALGQVMAARAGFGSTRQI
jgi:hydrogenase maturation protein HypF